jgi:hypothetical protein
MSSANSVLLRNAQYRRLFVARTISNIGNGIAPIALAFGVLALPGSSATSLSIVLTAQAIPLVVMLPFGGVIADRFGRARAIALSDIAMGVVVMTSAVLLITGHATVPLLAALGFIGGLLIGIWWPAFSGLVPDVVTSEDHLQPANAYISVGSNAGMIVGSAIGGLLVAFVGAGYAMAIDAMTFIIAGFLVFSFRHVSKPNDSGESVVGDLAHGWKVFVSFRWIVVVVAAFSVIVMVMRGAEEVMGPVLAQQEYGGAAGWAVVLGSMSVGLLLGAVSASRIRASRPLVVAISVTFALPVFLVALAFALPLAVVAAAAFLWGVAFEVMGVLWFTTMQKNVPRESLSRVSSYDAMGSLMFGPIGLALAGPLVTIIGLQTSFLIAAGVVALALAACLCAPSVRGLRAEPVEVS